MLSRIEEKTLYLSILIMARVQPLYAQDLGRKRNKTKDVAYVIDKLVRDGLVIEIVKRNGEGIPKVTIEITDKGIQYLHELEQDQKMSIELSTTY
jgi:DNA-binding PadR family transcriptional regulator